MGIKFFIIIVLVLMSGFFSASEISLFGLSKSKLKLMIESKEKNIDLIEKMLADKDLLLSGILLGNNLTNISATSVATLLFVDLFGKINLEGYGPLFSTIFMTVLLLIVGAVIPKTFATRQPDKVAILLAKPLYIILKILSPVAILLSKLLKKVTSNMDKDIDDTISGDEVRAMAMMSSESGGIKEEQSTFIKEVLNLSTTKVKEIMINKSEMQSITVTDSLEKIRMIMDLGLSHIPVFDVNHLKIIGVLHVRSLIYADSFENISLEKYMSKPFFVYDTLTAEELLRLFQQNNCQLAIVNNEYGEITGIVSIEDIMELLVGELHDEFDIKKNDISKINVDTYIVQAKVKLNKFNKHFGTNLTALDSTSIGGYLIEKHGRNGLVNPHQIEHLEMRGIDIEGNTLNRIKVTVLPKQNPETEEKVQEKKNA